MATSMSTVKLCCTSQEWRFVATQRARASADRPACGAHFHGSATVCVTSDRLERQRGAGPHHRRLPAGAAEIPCPPHAGRLPCCAGCCRNSAPQSEVSGVALTSQSQWSCLAVVRSVHSLQTLADVTALRHNTEAHVMHPRPWCYLPLPTHSSQLLQSINCTALQVQNGLLYTLPTLKIECSTNGFKHLCKFAEVGASWSVCV